MGTNQDLIASHCVDGDGNLLNGATYRLILATLRSRRMIPSLVYRYEQPSAGWYICSGCREEIADDAECAIEEFQEHLETAHRDEQGAGDVQG